MSQLVTIFLGVSLISSAIDNYRLKRRMSVLEDRFQSIAAMSDMAFAEILMESEEE